MRHPRRKSEWLTNRLKRSDIHLMREMKAAGWSVRYISRIFSINYYKARAYCAGRSYADV